MIENAKIETPLLTDQLGRQHNYLRLSITPNCNLKCIYCMPEHMPILPEMMTVDEIFTIAKFFVNHGVDKIRLTGGEPLVRKHFIDIIDGLAQLPVELALTTNGVIIDRFIEDLKRCNIRKINVSLDSLQEQKNIHITKKNYLKKVIENIDLLCQKGFDVKVNCVLMKGINDNEVIDFVHLSKDQSINIRFIEFMPFDGNQWDLSKLVGLDDILKLLQQKFDASTILRTEDRPNDTSKNYKIEGYKGTFSIISTVTNPFCDTCNRIRVTADGQIKNCLFSTSEVDLLSALRNKEDINALVKQVILSKHHVRAGLETMEDFKSKRNHAKNRSMIAIGG